MKYVPSNKLQVWRKRNEPKHCPILKNIKENFCVDHDHKTGMIRGVISREANTLIGKIENIYYTMCKGKREDIGNVMEAIAHYLMYSKTDYLHPVGCKQLMSRFKRLCKGDQEFALQQLGFTMAEINACNNLKERVLLYSKFLKKEFYGRNKRRTKHKS
tara:strand:+ start:2494 stop:2970 length:477 start_codon:yes stop_codon:yes gene_type:complete